MTIHKEGTASLIISILSTGIITFFIYYLFGSQSLYFSTPISLALVFFMAHFFRKPTRIATLNDNVIIAPADGKVVVIEETTDDEYFNARVKQVSIFMSPLNVHINWYPVSGDIQYYKYHKGLKMPAWEPKSSTENERSSVVIKTKGGKELLVKQIAGALARRIVAYSKDRKTAQQGQELGFIKFGSRVDILLPLDAKIMVNLGDKVIGNKTIIASFK
ncbi:MAG: phosphatidylserine decarboxylase family protein [Bacteroidales bacterium]|nr:phosphatidylserine decarboxylase family protein [Bacteroidales bacterium]